MLIHLIIFLRCGKALLCHPQNLTSQIVPTVSTAFPFSFITSLHPLGYKKVRQQTTLFNSSLYLKTLTELTFMNHLAYSSLPSYIFLVKVTNFLGIQ